MITTTMSMQLPSDLLLPWLLFFVALLFLFYKQTLTKKPTNSPCLPSPKTLPIIGNLHQLGALPHHSLRELAAELAAPLMLLRLGAVPILVVSSADAARAVFKHHDLAFSGRPALYAATKLTYGLLSISFAPRGEFWRAARRICVSELLSERRVQSFRAVREEEVAALVGAIGRAPRSGVVNLSDMFLATTNKITRRIAFGNADYDGGHPGGFYTILEETQKLLGAFWVADFVPWLAWVDVARGLRRRLERNFQEMDAFYERVIEEHLKARAERDAQEDLVDVLLRLHEDPVHRSTFSTRSHIKGILADMFVAGTDTSAATLAWTITELMRHPRVMAKAQQEVRSVIGNKGEVEECDLSELPYLKLVLKESLRLHPPAPLLVPRETIEACTIAGYEIPPKTRVFVNAKAIGMDLDAWTDPARFWPERFIGTDVEFGGQDFGLLPFGVGRRSCPGVHFAVAVVELLLANLLYCFDWELPFGMTKEDLDLEEAIGLTVHRKNPLCLVAKPRNAAIVT